MRLMTEAKFKYALHLENIKGHVAGCIATRKEISDQLMIASGQLRTYGTMNRKPDTHLDAIEAQAAWVRATKRNERIENDNDNIGSSTGAQ